MSRNVSNILWSFSPVSNIQQTSCRDKTGGPQFGEDYVWKKKEKAQVQEPNGRSRRGG